jgi:hypothetical protein
MKDIKKTIKKEHRILLFLGITAAILYITTLVQKFMDKKEE